MNHSQPHLSLCCTGTTHICRSVQASGSPRTNSTFMTPNCFSCALLLNNHSAWTQEEEAERATSTSFHTSSTLCSTSSTRVYLFVSKLYLINKKESSDFKSVHEPAARFVGTVKRCEDDKQTLNHPISPILRQYVSCLTHCHLILLKISSLLVQGLRPGRRRTCRVSKSSHVKSGWRARTRWKDRTITPSWPCTSCRLSAGGVHVYTSYEDSWSPHTLARSLQSALTSMRLYFFFIFLSHNLLFIIPT